VHGEAECCFPLKFATVIIISNQKKNTGFPRERQEEMPPSIQNIIPLNPERHEEVSFPRQ
jgi:hypothetical protein